MMKIDLNPNVAYVNLAQLQTNTGQIDGVPPNPRLIKNKEFEELINSILVFPKMLFYRPITYAGEFVILGGNQRKEALIEISKLSFKQIKNRLDKQKQFTEKPEEDRAWTIEFWEEFCRQEIKQAPAQDASGFSIAEMSEFVIKDNVGFGEDDFEVLEKHWDIEKVTDWGLKLPENWDVNPTEQEPPQKHRKLTDMFVVPPFSILDSRQGYWNERKKEWKNIIENEGISREKTLSESELMGSINEGVSIFDPVLAELINKWFTPFKEKNKIIDPFSGGAFGFVSSYLGNEFTGVEIREEQAEINNKRINKFPLSRYIHDDGQNIGKHIEAETQDLLFSCPPYFNLEHYSDLPNDASNQATYGEFMQIIENAFSSAIECLKENRFAVVVCGDVRGKTKGGAYYGFPDDIKKVFERNGMHLYNELIFIETLGTLPQRVGRYMQNRKIGKCHQNVLVFFKGNEANIKKEFYSLTEQDYGSENE